ncbi:hypothetical protein ACFQZ4_12665 [Catellatospora coxensis]
MYWSRAGSDHERQRPGARRYAMSRQLTRRTVLAAGLGLAAAPLLPAHRSAAAEPRCASACWPRGPAASSSTAASTCSARSGGPTG